MFGSAKLRILKEKLKKKSEKFAAAVHILVFLTLFPCFFPTCGGLSFL
jgi:hypothetical protein